MASPMRVASTEDVNKLNRYYRYYNFQKAALEVSLGFISIATATIASIGVAECIRSKGSSASLSPRNFVKILFTDPMHFLLASVITYIASLLFLNKENYFPFPSFHTLTTKDKLKIEELTFRANKGCFLLSRKDAICDPFQLCNIEQSRRIAMETHLETIQDSSNPLPSLLKEAFKEGITLRIARSRVIGDVHSAVAFSSNLLSLSLRFLEEVLPTLDSDPSKREGALNLLNAQLERLCCSLYIKPSTGQRPPSSSFATRIVALIKGPTVQIQYGKSAEIQIIIKVDNCLDSFEKTFSLIPQSLLTNKKVKFTFEVETNSPLLAEDRSFLRDYAISQDAPDKFKVELH